MGSTGDWYHLPITETDDLALSSADLRKVLNKGRSIWENECFSLDFREEKAKPRGLPGGGADWVAREGLPPGGGALGAGVGSVWEGSSAGSTAPWPSRQFYSSGGSGKTVLLRQGKALFLIHPPLWTNQRLPQFPRLQRACPFHTALLTQTSFSSRIRQGPT